MNKKTFKAMVVEEIDGKFERQIKDKSIDELPGGDLLIRVSYSSLNYKDALSATGNKGVTKNYPHTPGVDASGIVEESSTADFQKGDEVLITGYDLGANTSGGFGQYIRVPASWVVKLPQDLSLKESMIYGTAGFTAALSVFKLEGHGINPESGEILVTGASGGVGSTAVGILAKEGYKVIAVTGKMKESSFLMDLGAKEIMSRDDARDNTGRPLLKGRWAGVIDTVGGDILATALKSTKQHGVITCCGNVASSDLITTVYPFILRGVSLLGVDSAFCSMPTRRQIWQRISRQWKLDRLDLISSEISLEELDNKIDLILQGKLKGRVLINLSE